MDAPSSDRLRVTEVFHSLQGESRSAGVPTVFVRLTGCPLRCRYCDTAYAFDGGQWTEMESILAQVACHDARFVTVTGGEPLAQPACRTLLRRLCDGGYVVSVETGGALNIAGIDARVCIVMDLKTPGSGELARNDYANLAHLKSTDQIKFVLCDRIDYEWARGQLRQRALDQCCEVLFSPVWEELDAAQLAEWILADHLPVRMQLQLHKILWGDAPGR